MPNTIKLVAMSSVYEGKNLTSRMAVEVRQDGKLVVTECYFTPGSAGFGYLHVATDHPDPATPDQVLSLAKYWATLMASNVIWECPQPPYNYPIDGEPPRLDVYDDWRGTWHRPDAWHMPPLGRSACLLAFRGLTPDQVAAMVGVPMPLLNR